MSGFHHQNVLPVSTDYLLLRLERDAARMRKETAEPGASASHCSEVRQTESC